MPFTPIRFGSDATHLTVTPLERLEYGTLSEVSFRVMTFSGSFEATTFLGGGLLQKIQKMYGSLSGSVSLSALDDEFSLDLEATGYGRIAMSVQLDFEGLPEVQLNYRWEIDQTFLPPAIQALQQNLPLLDPLSG